MSNETSGNSKAPTHIAYHVRDGRSGGKAFWTRIGAAWPHKDGNGFNLQFEVVPLDGRVVSLASRLSLPDRPHDPAEISEFAIASPLLI